MSKVSIDIDDELLREISKLTGLNDASEIVNLAMRELGRQRKIQKLSFLRDKGLWEGNLDEWRKLRMYRRWL